VTGDTRARLVGKMRQAMIDADAAAPPNDDLGYTDLAEFALDALTDDDLADLLGLRWEPFHSRYADEGQQATHRRLIGPWQPVEPT